MIFQISNYVFEMVGRLNLFDYFDAVCIGRYKKVRFSNGENIHRICESRGHHKFREQFGGSAGQMACEQINLNHGIKNIQLFFKLCLHISRFDTLGCPRG